MKIWLFDLNGTLLNDNQIWRQSIVSVFKKFNIEPPTVAQHFEEMDRSKGDYMKTYTSRGVPLSREQAQQIYCGTYQSMFDQVELQAHTAETLRTIQASKEQLLAY